MLTYIQLILLLSSSLSSPITTSTYSSLFNASTLVFIVALPFLISYYSTPIRIDTALFDTTAIDDQINSLLFDSDNFETIIDGAVFTATNDDGYCADESDLDEIFSDSDDLDFDLESIIDDLSETTEGMLLPSHHHVVTFITSSHHCFITSSLHNINANCPSSIVASDISPDDLPFDGDDSCIYMESADAAEGEDAWEAMKAAAGCGDGESHRILSSFFNTDTNTFHSLSGGGCR